VGNLVERIEEVGSHLREIAGDNPACTLSGTAWLFQRLCLHRLRDVIERGVGEAMNAQVGDPFGHLATTLRSYDPSQDSLLLEDSEDSVSLGAAVCLRNVAAEAVARRELPAVRAWLENVG
jgi:hypothetical protein